MKTTSQGNGLISSLCEARNIAVFTMLASFLVVAESQAAVERYKDEANFLARLVELGYDTTVNEGFESSAWDDVRTLDVNNSNTSQGVLSQGILWEPASTDVFGQTATTGVSTNFNWARSGQWGLFETQTPFFEPPAVRASSTSLIFGVGGWFDASPDTESIGFLLEGRTTANAPGYVLPGLGAYYPGDNAGSFHRFAGIVDPDGFNSVVMTGTLSVNEEGVLEGGSIFGSDDYTFAIAPVPEPSSLVMALQASLTLIVGVSYFRQSRRLSL